MPRRYDRGQLKSQHVTDEGFLFLDAYVTRVGIFDYRSPDGTVRRELRPPDEVLRQDSLVTLGRKPVTLDHPPVDVTPDNSQEYARGSVGERVSNTADGFVQVSLTVYGADAIDSIQRGDAREVSCGYICDLDETPGLWDGEPYDAIQRNIRYNHVALVDEGRAGHDVKVRFDGAAYMIQDTDTEGSLMRKKQDTDKQDMPPMEEEELEVKAPKEGMEEEEMVEDKCKTETDMEMEGEEEEEMTGDMEYPGEEMEEELEEEMEAMAMLKKALKIMKGERDDLMKKVKDLKKALDKKNGAEDALRAQLDAMRSDKADDTFAKRKEWMAERTELLDLAKRLDVADVDKLDNVDMMRAIVTKHNGDSKRTDSYSDDYVRGAMDMIRIALDDSSHGLQALANTIRHTDSANAEKPKTFDEVYNDLTQEMIKNQSGK